MSLILFFEENTMEALNHRPHFSTAPGHEITAPAGSGLACATSYKPYLQNFVAAHSGRINAQPGYLRLDGGRAVRLVATSSGVLRIAEGRVWATFDHAAAKNGPRAGDYFANCGDGLPLLAGQSVVIESFALGDAAAAYFSWEPWASPQPCPAAAPLRWAVR